MVSHGRGCLSELFVTAATSLTVFFYIVSVSTWQVAKSQDQSTRIQSKFAIRHRKASTWCLQKRQPRSGWMEGSREWILVNGTSRIQQGSKYCSFALKKKHPSSLKKWGNAFSWPHTSQSVITAVGTVSTDAIIFNALAYHRLFRFNLSKALNLEGRILAATSSWNRLQIGKARL